MSIYKYRGKWRAEVWVNGRRHETESGFGSRKAASDWRDERRVSLRAGGGERAPALTFDALLAKFESHHLSTVRPLTKQRYLVDIQRRLLPFFKYRLVSSVTPALVEEFRAEIMRELSPKSVNNCLHTLRLVLNKAVRWGIIKESPYQCESLRLAKIPYEWWETREEIQRFLAVARTTRYFPVYLTALETGMRYSEIIGLSKPDIDFEHGTIKVWRQWHERIGQYGPTKGGEPRWIDFDTEGELAQVLKRCVELSPHPEAVFVTATGRRPTKGGVADKYFKAIQRRAGVKVINFHALRHNYASWFMRERGDVWALKAILGHADIKTTQRYAHHSKRERQQPLCLGAAFPHKSHTSSDSTAVTSGDRYQKEWRDGRDLNSKAPAVTPIRKAQ